MSCREIFPPAEEIKLHSQLLGLDKDDHLQYLTKQRADAFYQPLFVDGDKETVITIVNDLTYNVGPSREFKLISELINYLKNTNYFYSGNIFINVDPGTYNETKIDITSVKFLGAIYIVGGDNPDDTIIQFGDELHGFLIRYNKTVSIGGLTIKGSLMGTDTNTPVVTNHLFYLTQNSILVLGYLNKKTIIDGGSNIFYLDNSKVYCSFTQNTSGSLNTIVSNVDFNNVFQFITGSKNVVIDIRGAVLNGLGNIDKTFTRERDIYQFTSPNKPASVTVPCKISGYLGNNVTLVVYNVKFNNFKDGIKLTTNSFYLGGYEEFNSINGISLYFSVNVHASSSNSKFNDCNGSIHAFNHSYIYAPGTTSNNVVNPFKIDSFSNAQLENSVINNATTGIYASNYSLVNALNTSANITNTQTKYDPPTSGVLGNTQSTLNWS